MIWTQNLQYMLLSSIPCFCYNLCLWNSILNWVFKSFFTNLKQSGRSSELLLYNSFANELYGHIHRAFSSTQLVVLSYGTGNPSSITPPLPTLILMSVTLQTGRHISIFFQGKHNADATSWPNLQTVVHPIEEVEETRAGVDTIKQVEKNADNLLIEALDY